MLNDATVSVVDSLGKISVDIFGVLAFVLLLSVLGITKGKNILFTLLLALYPSALIVVYFPYYDSIHVGSNAASKIFAPLSLLLLSTAIIFSILRRYINAGYQFRTFWRFVEAVTLSISIIGFSMVLLYHVVEIETYYNFSFIFDTLFASPTAFFLWILAPLLTIPLFVRA